MTLIKIGNRIINLDNVDLIMVEDYVIKVNYVGTDNANSEFVGDEYKRLLKWLEAHADDI